MCLACEMDVLWFAEIEATALGTAGVPPALKDRPASLAPGSLKEAGETPAVPAAVPGLRGLRGEVKTGGTPAVPGFRCEETGS
jgi:hypothetical protein